MENFLAAVLEDESTEEITEEIVPPASEDDDGNKEDPYERVDEKDREDLPMTNVANYAQENDSYFAQKKYVRNDKYTLKEMLTNCDEMPHIMTAFSS
mmetsp:Transcript_3383/g.5172  ORF Transcript_3383/g.5172 Transcript_3383/m.5172 type:complete len:97 (+) Transcript_3383:484-774(+)